MGNTPESNQTLTQNQLTKTIQHPHLGQIKTTENAKYKNCYLKIYHFADQMMGMQKMRRINARIKKFAQSQYILSIKGVQLIPRHQMCSNNTDVNLYFEKYTQSLRTIITSRIKQKKVFAQKEIYQFLNQVLQALIFQQDNGFKNCHLDKDSIVVCQNKIKLVDLGIATTSPYQTFLDKMVPIQGFYLAPQLLKDLKDKNYQPYISPKSDIFCLGMIILQLACLQSLDSYYDFQKGTIDYQSLIHRVSRIVYSVQLKTLIAGMLQFQSDLRLGLISTQQKVRKMLNLDKNQQGQYTTKRSRSSSTKMLKQLLTNSRRTVTASHKQNENKSLTKKPSNASLTSMASINSRYSYNKNHQDNKIQNRKQTQLYPTKDQTSALRNLVKNKIQSRLMSSITQKQTQIIQQNKQNRQQNIKQHKQFANRQILQNAKDQIKLLQQSRNFNYAPSSFLGSIQYNKFSRRLDSVTPKMNEEISYNKIGKQQQSIFKLIQENYTSLNTTNMNMNTKGNNTINTNKNTNTNYNTRNVPQFSPVVPPMLPHVQSTTSIKKEAPPSNYKIRQITQFNESIKKQPSLQCINIQNQSPQHSISLRVKKSLDKMYKTTQSISSSQQKQMKRLNFNNQYNRIMLQNGYYYQGEVKDGDIFEGNGILYGPEGQIVYSGSWANGLYDGFGTSHNLQVNTSKIDMRNFNQNPKNWIKYQGQFNKGQRQGFGTIYYANGQRFSGCMRNGQINGYGCFYNNCNEMTSGIWVNNRLQQ